MMNTGSLAADETVDARQLPCPMPLLRAKQALNRMPAGAVLCLVATDKGSVRDVRAFCELAGHELLEQNECDGEFVHLLRKKNDQHQPNYQRS